MMRGQAPRPPIGRAPAAIRTHSTRLLRATLAVAIACAVAPGCASKSPKAAARSSADAAPLAALLPTTPAPAGTPYQIQTGDELHVRFVYHPEMNEQVPVRPDGRITLGTTGELEVVGMTPGELEHLIEQRSSRRLREPEVVIVVTKVAERRVYIGGEVAKPGYVILQAGMTPLQAVMQSGGFKPSAKLDSVLLLTPGGDGKFTAARMDMAQVVEEGVPERVRLHPGDVVYVPTTWIADMNLVIDQWVRGLIPALPRVGVGYSLSQ